MAWNAKVMFFPFPGPARTYQAFSEVEQLPSVGRAAILERAEDGTPSVPESYEPGAGSTTAVGGIVGALVGLLGGPMGVFLGRGAGTLVGMASDADDAAGSMDALTVLSRGVDNGSNVLVAGAEEDDPGPADAVAGRAGLSCGCPPGRSRLRSARRGRPRKRQWPRLAGSTVPSGGRSSRTSSEPCSTAGPRPDRRGRARTAGQPAAPSPRAAPPAHAARHRAGTAGGSQPGCAVCAWRQT
ncbi:hypothetical protein [Streptomyces sp. HB2AG]|uniref:hypothetical protein n=1 Tax=Streptomyces sp. HB2AG TaxID=2983400 RepID=UPI0022AAB871|nr:hypothetical protein [Streptomyces sp. HB2AG]MCZ2525958.1 hypothetical protein [Streptomyces sp. HB2AG]